MNLASLLTREEAAKLLRVSLSSFERHVQPFVGVHASEDDR